MHTTIYRRIGVAVMGAVGGTLGLVLLSFFWHCPILAATGFSCPGCGMTRAFFALLKLDIYSAYTYNPFVFVLCAYAAVWLWAYIANNKRVLGSRIFYGSLGALALAFSVWRIWGQLPF